MTSARFLASLPVYGISFPIPVLAINLCVFVRAIFLKMFIVCGPKLSICCTIVSVWGIVQLALMGGFFYTHSLSLAEDLGLPDEFNGTMADYLKKVDDAYENQAYKCWVAVAIYAVTLVFCLFQLFLNKKRSYQT